jgi:hypothetical protein
VQHDLVWFVSLPGRANFTLALATMLSSHFVGITKADDPKQLTLCLDRSPLFLALFHVPGGPLQPLAKVSIPQHFAPFGLLHLKSLFVNLYHLVYGRHK